MRISSGSSSSRSETPDTSVSSRKKTSSSDSIVASSSSEIVGSLSSESWSEGSQASQSGSAEQLPPPVPVVRTRPAARPVPVPSGADGWVSAPFEPGDVRLTDQRHTEGLIDLCHLSTGISRDRTRDRASKKYQDKLAHEKMRKEQVSSYNEIRKYRDNPDQKKSVRKAQRSALSSRLATFAHLEMPAFYPDRSSYWTGQHEMMKFVSRSADWQTLKMNFINLTPGVLGKKGSLVFEPVMEPGRKGRSLQLGFRACRFNAADGAAFARYVGGKST